MIKLVDISNKAEIVAAIQIYKDRCIYLFDAQDESAISDFLALKLGEKVSEITGVPLFIEASAWCVLAGVGESFKEDDFDICIKSVLSLYDVCNYLIIIFIALIK